MSSATIRRGEGIDPAHLLIAVVSALLLHVVAFLVFWLWQWAMLVYESERPPTPPIEFAEDEGVTVELNAALFERFQPPPVLEPIPPAPENKPAFMKTAPEQESAEAPEEAAFIGERNTIAASELAPDPNGPAVPSQDGEEPRQPNDLTTFDSSFADGEEPASAGTGEVEPRMKEGVTTDQPEGDGSPGSPEGAEIPEEGGAPKETVLESENQIPVPVEAGPQDERMEEALPKKAETESETKGVKQGEGGNADRTVKEQPKKPGFRSESKKTKLRGSIRRRGRSAVDVDDTIVGRYQAKVSRALESEWQRKCVMYRDHISPGILTIRFFVDQKGQTSGLRYLDVLHASEIQKGFTVNAIRDAKIPAMPKDVVAELEGEPLELIISFRF